MSDHPGAGDELGIVQIAKHVFREFCAAKEYDTEQILSAKIKEFFYWYRDTEQNVAASTDACLELRTQLKLSYETCEFFHQIMQCPFAAQQVLFALWPMLVLAPRPPLRNKIKFLRLVLHATFEDDKVLNLVGQSLAEENDAMTDGLVTTLFRSHAIRMTDMFGQLGVDALNEKYAQYPPEVLARRNNAAAPSRIIVPGGN